MSMIDWLINIGGHHLALVALLIGTLSAWAIATLIELLLISPIAPDACRQVLTVAVTIVVSILTCVALWCVLEPDAPRSLIWTVSVILSPISPFSYVWVGRLVTRYFPAVGSVWSLKP